MNLQYPDKFDRDYWFRMDLYKYRITDHLE